MPLHRHLTPDKWEKDIKSSVDQYNTWFLKFAPDAYSAARKRTTDAIRSAVKRTDYLTNITGELLRAHPEIVPILRMACCPPIARDRLTGLSGVPKSFVQSLDKKGVLPTRMKAGDVTKCLDSLATLFTKMLDYDIFPWVRSETEPTVKELEHALTAISERHCGAITGPLIRNAQEVRQLKAMRAWLEARGYKLVGQEIDAQENAAGLIDFENGEEEEEEKEEASLQPGQFSFRTVIKGKNEKGALKNIPVDLVVMRKTQKPGDLPLLIEAKSAGDFANTNKRWKEEATKKRQLIAAHGPNVEFALFLCGYFDKKYLSNGAGDAIDWVWEHRIDDLAHLGL